MIFLLNTCPWDGWGQGLYLVGKGGGKLNISEWLDNYHAPPTKYLQGRVGLFFRWGEGKVKFGGEGRQQKPFKLCEGCYINM